MLLLGALLRRRAAPSLDWVKTAGGAVAQWDMDFVNDRGAVSGAAVPPGAALQCVRASAKTAVTAARTLVAFAANVLARTSAGLLCEAATINYTTQSDAVESGTLFGTTTTLNLVTAPDGSQTADTLTETTAAGGHSTYRTLVGLPDSTVVVASWFVKYNGRAWVSPMITGKDNVSRRAFFNIQTGAVGTPTGSPTSYGIEAFADGWWRVWVASNVGVGATAPLARLSLASTDLGSSYTGDGVSGAHVWGADVEIGTRPTSYLPTAATAVARAADSVSANLFASWWSAVAGSLFCSAVVPTAGPVTLLDVSDGTPDNRITLRVNATLQPEVTVTTGGVVQAVVSGAPLLAGASVRACVAYGPASFRAAFNGVLATPVLAGAVPAVDRASVGCAFDGTQQPGAPLRETAAFSVALSDANLQAVTA